MDFIVWLSSYFFTQKKNAHAYSQVHIYICILKTYLTARKVCVVLRWEEKIYTMKILVCLVLLCNSLWIWDLRDGINNPSYLISVETNDISCLHVTRDGNPSTDVLISILYSYWHPYYFFEGLGILIAVSCLWIWIFFALFLLGYFFREGISYQHDVLNQHFRNIVKLY